VAIEWLHPVDAIGGNGLHAVVVAPVLVRVEMPRKGRTYEMLVTRHRPGERVDGKRPTLETKVLFRDIHGRLELGLSGKDKIQAGAVADGPGLRLQDRFHNYFASGIHHRDRGVRFVWLLEVDASDNAAAALDDAASMNAEAGSPPTVSRVPCLQRIGNAHQRDARLFCLTLRLNAYLARLCTSEQIRWQSLAAGRLSITE
jgi:hypothetical protein